MNPDQNPIEVAFAATGAPEVGRVLDLAVTVVARWADFEDARARLFVALPVVVLEGPPPTLDLVRDEPVDLLLRVIPVQPGLHLVALTLEGDAPPGTLGGYGQAYLDVPAEGTGRVHAPGLPTPEFGAFARPVDPSAFPPEGPAAFSGEVPAIVEAVAPLPKDPSVVEVDTDPGISAEAHATFQARAGLFYWDEPETNSFPLRWVLVDFFDNDFGADADDFLTTCLGGTDGFCTSDPIARVEEAGRGNQDVYVRFRIGNGAGAIRTTSNQDYTWFTPTTTVGTEDLHDKGGWLPPDTQRWVARPFHYLMNGWDFAVNRMGVSTSILNQARIFIPDNCTFYTGGDDVIHLCNDGIGDKSPDDVLHEYGHYIMDKLYRDSFFPPGSGGAHFLCDNQQTAGLAWSEGFADWFGPQANHDIKNANDVSYDRPWNGAQFSINMETQTFCGSPQPGGDRSEVNVAWAMWDAVDAAVDGADDGSPVPLGNMRAAMDACNNNHYRAYYDGVGGASCSHASLFGKGGGGFTEGFLRAAFRNVIDYDSPPTASVTTQTSFVWNGGTITIGASTSDSDSLVRSVTFHVSSDGACDGNDVAAGTDTLSPFSVSFNTAALPDGANYRTCARANDGMTSGAWATSSSGFGLDNTPPGATASVVFITGPSTYAVTWSASDALSKLNGQVRIERTIGGLNNWITLCSPTFPSGSGTANGSCTDGTVLPAYYCYRTVATDIAGNQGISPQSCTVHL